MIEGIGSRAGSLFQPISTLIRLTNGSCGRGVRLPPGGSGTPESIGSARESSWTAVAISPPILFRNVVPMFVSEYEYASKGASMRMRLIAVLAVLIASFTLGGCFFHHHQTVMAEPEALPPLK